MAVAEANPRTTANPYKGPYAFELKDAALFTGREEEAETLLSLAISERIVVFCAPSGAGKSSLLNARLLPGLRRRGFKVLPVVRVGGDLPEGVEPANVFVFNALWILAGAKADPAALKDCTLDGFLKPIPRAKGHKGPPRVLVFDQFEEILTTHQDRWPERKDFFLQLRQALLDDPTLSVVMSLREDHLAGFDAYAPLLPGQLRTRFRMETLRRDKAVAAARQPALAAGRPFDKDVAEELVKNLSQVRVPGQPEPVPGEFVEPVQLQVVCFQLWENLRDERGVTIPGETITEEDRRRFGDPDQALEGFYESALRRAAEKTGVAEARIRHWCGTALITPTRIRGQVNREPEASGGLPNPAIESLVDSHLVRAEVARGGTWYELAHDRFVEPILRSNQRAAPPETTRLSEDARAWSEANRDPSFLYSGLLLEEALKSSKEGGVPLGPGESEFLARSEKAQADAQTRKAHQLWIAVGALAALLLAVAGLAYVAWQQSRLAFARELALAAIAQSADDPELGLLLALEAVRKAPIPETEAALHEALRASVVRQDRTLPIDSDFPYTFAFSPDGRRFASALGAVGIWETASGRPVDVIRPVAQVISLAYGPDGVLAYGDAEGRVTFWHPGSSSPPPPPLTIGFPVGFLAYSPDGSRLAIAGGSPDVRIWNVAAKTFETIPGEPGTVVLNVAFSREGRFLAIVPEQETEEGLVLIQDLQNPRPFGLPLRHSSPVTSVAFGLHGMLATGCQDPGLRIWNWRRQEVLQTLYGHRDRISDVAFSPDGDYLATASFDGEARLWNLGSGESQYVLSPEGGRLSRVAFNPRASKLATVSERGSLIQMGTLTLWDIVLDKDLVLPVRAYHLTGFTPDSRSLIAVDPQGKAILWNFSSQKLGPPLLGGADRIGRARLTAQGSLLALRGQEMFRQPVLPSGPVSRNRIGPALEHSDFIVSPDGRFLAFAHEETVHLVELGGDPWNPRITALPEQEGPVVAMTFDPKATRLALTRNDGSIQLWSIAEKEPGPILRSNGSSVLDIEISPDGRWLASAGGDRMVRLWNLETGTVLQTFEGHTGRVITVAFSPDGRRLASGDEEGQIRVWEIAEGRSIFALPASTQSVVDLAFSPDGKWLAIVGSDGTVRREPMALGDLIERAHGRISRPLTPQERRIYLHSN
jgi:WD40 repeat protein